MTVQVDISALQRLASDPKVSAWVAASAGSGKTKVLTDRLLTLMLGGCPPDRLVCLTFTKAAAAEMSTRLTKRLSRWAVASAAVLQEELELLLGHAPSADHMNRGRSLFTAVLETPGGMKILTIHGFCQSILSRFPLEAQISPDFSIIDDQEADTLLEKARDHVLNHQEDEECQKAIGMLITHMTDTSFQSMLQEINHKKTAFKEVLSKFSTLPSRMTYCHQTFDIPQTIKLDSPDLLDRILSLSYTLSPSRKEVLTALSCDYLPAQDLVERWIKNPTQRATLFHDYKRLYLNLADEPLKKPKIPHPEEADQIFQIQETLNRAELAQKTLCMQTIADRILKIYARLKHQQSALDYDDLIDYTQKLLEKPDVASWVLYKLDGGFDHLLVDEAQDTNPRQWQIIRALTLEFFTPHHAYRTVFAVGDVKQSIYSFQGAKPKEFKTFQYLFQKDCQRNQQPWREVGLGVSFRSTPQVLAIVDEVFRAPLLQQGLSLDGFPLFHESFRTKDRGVVELWPLIQFQEPEEIKPWAAPTANFNGLSSAEKMANFITEKIKNLLDQSTVLPSTGLPVRPQDILILVRKRSYFSQELIWCLKRNNIPVAGADRFLLTDHLAVCDLMALGNFLCLPTDDYSLACVLKSPLIGLTEDQLFELAHDRSHSLWIALNNYHSDASYFTQEFTQARDFLWFCLQKVDFASPYQLYSAVLSEKKGREQFISRFGQEVEDVLTEFLNQALLFEQKNLPSLQRFLSHLTKNPLLIKRELTDTHRNEIRIMTVHGAKGLQAPVVIIPEHIDARDQRDVLLWQPSADDTAHFVFVRPSLGKDTALTKTLKERLSLLENQEKARLLYVALTRAQDHLYLCGWRTKKTDSPELPESWYKRVDEALTSLESVTLNDGTRRFPAYDSAPNRYNDSAFSGADPHYPAGGEFSSFPSWLKTSLPPAALLTPSASSLSAPANEPAPATAMDHAVFNSQAVQQAAQRGILIHRLFEVLPDFLPCQWQAVGHRLIGYHGFDIGDYEQDLKSVCEILASDDFSTLFGPLSYGELEICEGETVGRIDRVVITPTHIQILDYKTTAYPPKHVKDVPKSYIDQLTFYAKVLTSLYPTHCLEAYLLWTQGPQLMRII